MAEAHDRPPEEFTLKLRRYDPESGEAPYWDEHTVELEPHRSVLEAILQARDRFDGSIGIRCSCRQAICGSCGVRVNGEPALACHTHLDAALSGAAGGVIEIEPMGNMPVIKDLIVDMDAVHWKKIQRVTPVAARQAAGARARVHRRQRVDGRRHADDGLHPVRRLRLGLPGDGGRPRLHRPGRARQGLPLRGRPARRRAARAPQRPRPGPAGHLRLHALLQVRRGVPEGRQPDGPDHAPAAHRDLRPAHRRPEQRRAPRGGLHHPGQGQRAAVGGRTAAPLLRRRLVVRQIPPRRGQRAAELAARDPEGAAARQGHADGRAQTPQDPERRPEARAGDLRPHRRSPRALRAEPLHQRRGRKRGRGGRERRRRRRRRRWPRARHRCPRAPGMPPRAAADGAAPAGEAPSESSPPAEGTGQPAEVEQTRDDLEWAEADDEDAETGDES